MKQIIQKEFRNIQSSTNIVSVNKSRVASFVHVARMIALRRAYTILTINQLFAKPKDISTASIKDLCLFIRDTGILNMC